MAVIRPLTVRKGEKEVATEPLVEKSAYEDVNRHLIKCKKEVRVKDHEISRLKGDVIELQEVVDNMIEEVVKLKNRYKKERFYYKAAVLLGALGTLGGYVLG